MIDEEEELKFYEWEYNPSFHCKSFCIKWPYEGNVSFIDENFEMNFLKLNGFYFWVFSHFMEYFTGFESVKDIYEVWNSENFFIKSVDDLFEEYIS